MNSLLQSLLVLSSVRNCFSKLNFLMISSVGRWARCALPVGSESLALRALLLNPTLSNLRCAPQAVLLTMMWSGVRSRITSSAAMGVDPIAPVMQRYASPSTFSNVFLVVASSVSIKPRNLRKTLFCCNITSAPNLEAVSPHLVTSYCFSYFW